MAYQNLQANVPVRFEKGIEGGLRDGRFLTRTELGRERHIARIIPSMPLFALCAPSERYGRATSRPYAWNHSPKSIGSRPTILKAKQYPNLKPARDRLSRENHLRLTVVVRPLSFAQGATTERDRARSIADRI